MFAGMSGLKVVLFPRESAPLVIEEPEQATVLQLRVKEEFVCKGVPKPNADISGT
jgi:hypothetical protein